jgi:hypothetical protein
MPTRLHIPKDWKRKATRALTNLNKPGVAAACFWRGHEYGIGKYTPETEDDHLLQCSEYPKDGKLRIQKLKNTPNVGIIFLVGKTLSIDRTPVSEGEMYGDFRIHRRGHDIYWETLKENGLVPQDSEYDDYPRGRVAYNMKMEKYSLFLDRCILKHKSIVKKIISELNLPTRSTKTDTDSHYRCYRCFGRGR